MTLQQYGGVRGTIHGKVWEGTYDRTTNTMHVHEVGRGALTQSPGT